jgi:hypothetical protein
MTTRHHIISLTISLIYVGLGTFWIFTSHGIDEYYFDWPFIIVLTLPVTVISFAIRFGIEDYFLPVILVQLVMIYLTYLTILKLVFKKKSI